MQYDNSKKKNNGEYTVTLRINGRDASTPRYKRAEAINTRCKNTRVIESLLKNGKLLCCWLGLLCNDMFILVIV